MSSRVRVRIYVVLAKVLVAKGEGRSSSSSSSSSRSAIIIVDTPGLTLICDAHRLIIQADPSSTIPTNLTPAPLRAAIWRDGCPTRNPVAACQIRPRMNPITASDDMPIASQGLQPNQCCVHACLSFSLSLFLCLGFSISYPHADLFPSRVRSCACVCVCVLTPAGVSVTFRRLTFDRRTTIDP